MNIRPDLQPVVADVAAGHAAGQTGPGQGGVAGALSVALDQSAADPVKVRARAQAETGPQGHLPYAGVGHPRPAGHVCGSFGVGDLLVHVNLDALSGCVDPAAAGPAEGDGDDPVDVGQQDGYSDGDSEAGYEGGDYDGCGDSAGYEDLLS